MGPAAAQEIRSNAPRSNADPAAAQDVRAAIDALSTDLYKVTARGRGNVVLSPYSVGIALAMARVGAVGETASQIEAVLHAAPGGDVSAGFNALDQALAERPGQYGMFGQRLELELAIANRLWGQKDLVFERAFLDELARDYGAGVQVVDYKAAAEGARRTINDWIAARTREHIKDLIPPGVIDAQTRLILTNAIYLKAAWRKRFNDAGAGTFHRADGSNVRAKMMRLTETLGYGAGDDYQAVRLPYAGGLSMILVVPRAGKLGSLERGLDGPTLRRAVNGLSDTPVRLSMPKFLFRSKARLKDVLGELGMPIALTTHADFSGMTNSEPLQIADVIHEAFIASDEKGTEAAAAAAQVYALSIVPIRQVELTIDRPFLFLIQDDETGAILFIGRVSDPTT